VWQVMTDPSVDASFPTMMLVHPDSTSSHSVYWELFCGFDEKRINVVDKNRIANKKIDFFIFFSWRKNCMGSLL
jgi:hypothetical protein